MEDINKTERSRVTARIPHQIRETLEQAAIMVGIPLNQFIVQAAIKEAHRVIEREQIIHLSREDAKLVCELLENPPSPNTKLQTAAASYQEKLNLGEFLDDSPIKGLDIDFERDGSINIFDRPYEEVLNLSNRSRSAFKECMERLIGMESAITKVSLRVLLNFSENEFRKCPRIRRENIDELIAEYERLGINWENRFNK